MLAQFMVEVLSGMCFFFGHGWQNLSCGRGRGGHGIGQRGQDTIHGRPFGEEGPLLVALHDLSSACTYGSLDLFRAQGLLMLAAGATRTAAVGTFCRCTVL